MSIAIGLSKENELGQTPAGLELDSSNTRGHGRNKGDFLVIAQCQERLPLRHNVIDGHKGNNPHFRSAGRYKCRLFRKRSQIMVELQWLGDLPRQADQPKTSDRASRVPPLRSPPNLILLNTAFAVMR